MTGFIKNKKMKHKLINELKIFEQPPNNKHSLTRKKLPKYKIVFCKKLKCHRLPVNEVKKLNNILTIRGKLSLCSSINNHCLIQVEASEEQEPLP